MKVRDQDLVWRITNKKIGSRILTLVSICLINPRQNEIQCQMSFHLTNDLLIAKEFLQRMFSLLSFNPRKSYRISVLIHWHIEKKTFYQRNDMIFSYLPIILCFFRVTSPSLIHTFNDTNESLFFYCGKRHFKKWSKNFFMCKSELDWLITTCQWNHVWWCWKTISNKFDWIFRYINWWKLR